MNSKSIVLALIAAGSTLAAGAANAGGVSWHIGINLPVPQLALPLPPLPVPQVVVAAPPPVYEVPQPVYYEPAQPYYVPPPVVYRRPVVVGYRPVPIVYERPVYRPPEYRYGGPRWDRGHDHDRGDRHGGRRD